MNTSKHHFRRVGATLVMVTAFAAALFAPTVSHASVANIHSSQIEQASCGGLNLPVCGIPVPRS